MWATIGIIAAAAVILAIEVPPLLKKKLKKELAVFSVLLIFGVGLGIAQALHMKIPNPTDWLIAIYKPLSDAIFGLLK